jgi:hypothetical protein
METLELHLVKGSSRDFELQARDSEGNDALIFLPSDTLASVLWAGDDQAPLLTPRTAWVNATTGVFTVSFDNPDSLSLSEGIYRIQSKATRTGRSAVIFDGTINIGDTFGADLPRPTYCTIDDLRTLAPWVEDIQDFSGQGHGFVDECADARNWLDENILRNWRGNYIGAFGYHSLALASWQWAGPRRSLFANQWLLNYLNQNTLMLTTPTGKRLVRACAWYAISQICQSNISRGKEYISRAHMALHQAETLLVCSSAELDIDGNGTPEIVVNFSSASTLYT